MKAIDVLWILGGFWYASVENWLAGSVEEFMVQFADSSHWSDIATEVRSAA